MLALKIDDTKSFMNKLLLKSVFDSFCLIEASITTFHTVHIDGRLQKDFYTSEELMENGLEELNFCYWNKTKPFFLDLIKGKKTPLNFKLTLSLAPSDIASFIQKSNAAMHTNDIKCLLINFKFDGNKILCTTGISLTIFIADKTLEYEWDSYVENYFKENGIISTHLD